MFSNIPYRDPTTSDELLKLHQKALQEADLKQLVELPDKRSNTFNIFDVKSTITQTITDSLFKPAVT